MLSNVEPYWYIITVIVLYLQVDSSKTCVNFQADRWYPTANMTIQHRMRVYDYYEPGQFLCMKYLSDFIS